jgi:hypothetical protein
MRATKSSKWVSDPTPAQQVSTAQTAAAAFAAAPTSEKAQTLIALLEALYAD